MSGYDWTDRYPLIVAAASRLKSSMIIDAEAVIQGPNGAADFEALHGRTRNAEAFAYVFDLLMLEGDDLRGLPWRERRAKLRRIFRRSKNGLVLSLAIVGRGPEVYAEARRMGLETVLKMPIVTCRFLLPRFGRI
jgi:bifunctional non-homologous end joining protein LigD